MLARYLLLYSVKQEDAMKDMILFKKYLKDISRKPLITREREKELAYLIAQGDEDALQEMINANLKLVVKISLEFYKGATSIMDIIQNGNMGLMRAAKKFDPTKEVKFSTYAAFWIKQSILRGFIKPSHTINISYRKDYINKQIKSFISAYFQKYDRFPDVDTIQEQCKVSRRDAVDVLFFFSSQDQSLNMVTYEEGEELINTVPDDHYNPEVILEDQSLIDEVNIAVDSLNDREREIIRKRYGFDYETRETLQTLGDRYSITAEAARQIEKRVLHYIRDSFPQLAGYFFTN